MPLDDSWPRRLLDEIEQTHGSLVAIERLAGMSLSGVWRARFGSTSLIVKSSPAETEVHFYERAAPSLRAAGVPIPELQLTLHEPDAHWLVIEDIPQPLPVVRADAWQPDAQIIAILVRLHASTRAQPPNLPEPPTRTWSDAMTLAALSCLPASDAASLRPLLTRVQVECQPVFAPWCWISGDPNPRNWGRRPDGSPVLFDWELFGPGTPATDLAVIVPGLGDRAAYARAATAYLAAWDGPETLPWNVDTLSRQITLAKVATVVQLLEGHVNGTADIGDDMLTWLTATIPAWLQTLAN